VKYASHIPAVYNSMTMSEMALSQQVLCSYKTRR